MFIGVISPTVEVHLKSRKKFIFTCVVNFFKDKNRKENVTKEVEVSHTRLKWFRSLLCWKECVKKRIMRPTWLENVSRGFLSRRNRCLRSEGHLQQSVLHTEGAKSALKKSPLKDNCLNLVQNRSKTVWCAFLDSLFNLKFRVSKVPGVKIFL